ncbi:MAG: hypothetical protein KKH33_08585 [Alphaproteobacteria bacterium]|nr:hypothetical protein [Alphaproteobacteria bacterium]
MRQQAKPYIVERKPSRKLKTEEQRPSIWGRLGSDIAKGLQDQQDEDHPGGPEADDRT